MGLMKRFLLVILLAVFVPHPVLAQQGVVGMPSKDMRDPSVLKYEPPPEPNIQPVKFLKQDPPVSLHERVDRLLHGIKASVPPEYDHYGYELRRYMAHISGPEVFKDPERIRKELSNVKKAEIILEYWRQEIMKEKTEIAKLIEEQNAATNTRTSFKYNAGTAMAFLSECHIWIQKNRELLEYFLKSQESYVYNEGKFEFSSQRERDAFAAIFIAAVESRNYINEYVPFAGMVY